MLGNESWTRSLHRSPPRLVPLVWTNLKATAAISGHKAVNQEWSIIMKPPQDMASFPFLQATAFLFWCWKTAPASPDATQRKRKGREQQQRGAEPSQAVWSPSHHGCNSAAPLLPEPPSTPVLLMHSQAQEKGPLTWFRALSDPTRFCLVPVFLLFSGWGKGKLSHEHPWHSVLDLSYTTQPSTRPVSILPLSEKPCQVLSWGRILFSVEYPSVGKTLSVLYSLTNSVVVLRFCGKLGFCFIISAIVSSTVGRGGGKGTAWVCLLFPLLYFYFTAGYCFSLYFTAEF